MTSPINQRIASLNTTIAKADSKTGWTGGKIKKLETINKEIEAIYKEVISEGSTLSKKEKAEALTSLRASLENVSKLTPKGIAASFPRLFPNQHAAIESLKTNATNLSKSIDKELAPPSQKAQLYGKSTHIIAKDGKKVPIMGTLNQKMEALASKLQDPTITNVKAELKGIWKEFDAIYENISKLDNTAKVTKAPQHKISEETALAIKAHAKWIVSCADTGLDIASKLELAEAKESAQELLEMLDRRT